MPTLFELAQLGDLEEIRKFTGNINAVDENGNTALHIAVKHNQYQCAELLLHMGAKVNLKNQDGYTPLLIATLASNTELVRLLILGGADLNAQDNDHWTALHLACVSGDTETLKWLIHYGAELQLTTTYDFTPLHIAALNNFKEGIEILLKTGANPHSLNKLGETAAQCALRSHHQSLAQFIEHESKRLEAYENSINQNAITGFVFEGGGVKGIAYLGAIKELIKQSIIEFERLKVISGTSAGSICALLLSLGYNMEELEHELLNLNFSDLLDGSNKQLFLEVKRQYEESGVEGIVGNTLYDVAQKVISGNFNLSDFMSGNIIKDISNAVRIKSDFDHLKTKFGGVLKEMMEDKGLFSGEILREKFVDWIRRKTQNDKLTFRELKELAKKDRRYKELYVMSYDLNSKMPIIYSAEHTPDALVSEAVYDSMAIPLFFKPRMNKVDGGIANNYPIALMRKLRQDVNFLGFRLVNPDLHEQYVNGLPARNNAPIDFFSYVARLAESFYLKQENDHALGEDRERTIYINTLEIGTIDFNMTPLNKRRLIDSGTSAAKHYASHMKQLEALLQLDKSPSKKHVQELPEMKQLKKHKLIDSRESESRACLPPLSVISSTTGIFANRVTTLPVTEDKSESSFIKKAIDDIDAKDEAEDIVDAMQVNMMANRLTDLSKQERLGKEDPTAEKEKMEINGEMENILQKNTARVSRSFGL